MPSRAVLVGRNYQAGYTEYGYGLPYGPHFVFKPPELLTCIFLSASSICFNCCSSLSTLLSRLHSSTSRHWTLFPFPNLSSLRSKYNAHLNPSFSSSSTATKPYHPSSVKPASSFVQSHSPTMCWIEAVRFPYFSSSVVLST